MTGLSTRPPSTLASAPSIPANWEELEGDYERREKAIGWMKSLPAGRDGTVAFLNEVTEEHCKAFLLSITIHSPLKFTVHWFDDTKTEVEMDSNIEDYRNTASYYDGHTMRDGSQRKRQRNIFYEL